jgi:hypothetical protein
LIVEGQVHGGIMQGLGQALLEAIVYDPGSGQLISGCCQTNQNSLRKRPTPAFIKQRKVDATRRERRCDVP